MRRENSSWIITYGPPTEARAAERRPLSISNEIICTIYKRETRDTNKGPTEGRH